MGIFWFLGEIGCCWCSGFSPFGFIGLRRKSKKESSKLYILVNHCLEREERGRDSDGDEEDREL